MREQDLINKQDSKHHKRRSSIDNVSILQRGGSQQVYLYTDSEKDLDPPIIKVNPSTSAFAYSDPAPWIKGTFGKYKQRTPITLTPTSDIYRWPVEEPRYFDLQATVEGATPILPITCQPEALSVEYSGIQNKGVSQWYIGYQTPEMDFFKINVYIAVIKSNSAPVSNDVSLVLESNSSDNDPYKDAFRSIRLSDWTLGSFATYSMFFEISFNAMQPSDYPDLVNGFSTRLVNVIYNYNTMSQIPLKIYPFWNFPDEVQMNYTSTSVFTGTAVIDKYGQTTTTLFRLIHVDGETSSDASIIASTATEQEISGIRFVRYTLQLQANTQAQRGRTIWLAIQATTTAGTYTSGGKALLRFNVS